MDRLVFTNLNENSVIGSAIVKVVMMMANSFRSMRRSPMDKFEAYINHYNIQDNAIIVT